MAEYRHLSPLIAEARVPLKGLLLLHSTLEINVSMYNKLWDFKINQYGLCLVQIPYTALCIAVSKVTMPLFSLALTLRPLSSVLLSRYGAISHQ